VPHAPAEFQSHRPSCRGPPMGREPPTELDGFATAHQARDGLAEVKCRLPGRRITGFDVPSTNHRVEFVYRL
jgi:hypothetical protein